ncbi:MAG: hypothetical protein Q3994_06825 [Prevotella sp.]|nr:hypothetical protein [Prevotella sp.]
MKKEKYIEQRCGKQTPFRMPDGYMDGVVNDVMSRVRESHFEKGGAVNVPFSGKRKYVWRWVVAAACICVTVFSVEFLMMDNSRQVSNGDVIAKGYDNVTYDDEYINDMAEYAMFDNGDLYACMEEAPLYLP